VVVVDFHTNTRSAAAVKVPSAGSLRKCACTQRFVSVAKPYRESPRPLAMVFTTVPFASSSFRAQT
jgi:hypothetical protein